MVEAVEEVEEVEEAEEVQPLEEAEEVQPLEEQPQEEEEIRNSLEQNPPPSVEIDRTSIGSCQISKGTCH